MSDFKHISDFKKSKLSKFPYQDPTYLSFALLFDWYSSETSPLLSGAAENFLQALIDQGGAEQWFYEERLADLRNFLKALKEINRELPWYWQSLTGLERLQQYDPARAYRGGDEAVISIETLESLNLPIAGLMHLYRRAIFDERKWSYILPKNLRKFKLYIYVTEVRNIQGVTVIKKPSTSVNTLSLGAIQGFPDNMKPSVSIVDINENIRGYQYRPYFMIGLGYCEFDMTKGTTIFESLSKNPDAAATNSIAISYETLEKIEARTLNGIIEEPEYASGYSSPAPDFEMEDIADTQEKSLADMAKDKLNGYADKFAKKAKAQLESLANDKLAEAEGLAATAARRSIPNPENVFSDFIRNVDNATDPSTRGNTISRAISENVYGIEAGTSIQDGLNQAAGAAINLGNVND